MFRSLNRLRTNYLYCFSNPSFHIRVDNTYKQLYLIGKTNLDICNKIYMLSKDNMIPDNYEIELIKEVASSSHSYRTVTFLLENHKYSDNYDFYLTNLETIKACFDTIDGHYIVSSTDYDIRNYDSNMINNIQIEDDICKKLGILKVDLFDHRGC